MGDITIKITAGFNGKTSEIIVDENSTIKELKEHYAKLIEPGLEACNFLFVLDTQMLNNNRRLNELLEGNTELELNITSITIRPRRVAFLKKINTLDLLYNETVRIEKMETILREEIHEKDENPTLASSDNQIIFAAVQQYKRALQFASENLKENREIVLAAVQQDGEALQYASKELRNDKDIVLAAVQQKRRSSLVCIRKTTREHRNCFNSVRTEYIGSFVCIRRLKS